mmetsp:Transcript_89633/g.161668  ORF Transcript_89633/g.161668 Transcript_89633/m.161668 type:complete len:90 (-) Transcript_89633:150-419(-)
MASTARNVGTRGARSSRGKTTTTTTTSATTTTKTASFVVSSWLRFGPSPWMSNKTVNDKDYKCEGAASLPSEDTARLLLSGMFQSGALH